MIDLYWNEFTSRWQLCPAPFPNNVTYNMNDVVDVSWNNQNYQCQPSLSTENIISIFNAYIRNTNTNLDANFIQILLNLKSINYEKSNRTLTLENIYKPSDPNNYNIGNTTLNDTVTSLGSFIFTPQVLEQYQQDAVGTMGMNVKPGDKSNEVNSTQAISKFYNQSSILLPTIDTVLLTEYKRVMVSVVSNQLVNSARLYQFTSDDKNTIFFNDTIPSVVHTTDTNDAELYCQTLFNAYNSSGVDVALFNNISLTSAFRFIVDNEDHPFTPDELARYIRCGYSALLNSTYTQFNVSYNASESVADKLVGSSLWSWSDGQPIVINNTISNNQNDTLSNGTTEERANNVAYNCVVLTESGWSMSNCYERHVIACQNESSRNDWKLEKTNKRNYFEIDKDDCPEGYIFSLPRSSTEMLSLITTAKQQNVEYPIWIDLNDITVQGCFVSGGPYAQCPYQRTITTNKFVRMIAPSFVVGVVVLALMFLEKAFRTNPIQTNRKRYWKKAIQEYYEKNDYEGVP
ncbi:hypothetical protein G210_0160, partial [Candida maltosa Xu316]